MSTETHFACRYFILSNVAFQGEMVGVGPVSSFGEAIKKARDLKVKAFHFYTIGDPHSGDMYMYRNIAGYEVREGDRQSIGVIMERTSVHGQ
jgi:hypothetical protein